jgi:hypothetical protein
MKRCIKCNNEHDGTFGSGKYCSKSCANSRTFSEDSKKKKREANKNQIPWNKNIRWAVVTSKCLYCGSNIEHLKSNPKKYHSECWLKASGGHRKGSGVGKSGWYKGYWCDSSYELAWIIYQLEHNKPFERNKVRYEYEWNGKIKEYIPDFIQNNDIIEIKGYLTEQTKVKLKSVRNLKVLFRRDLNKEFEYVETKYGKNFIELYEDTPKKIK